METRTAQSVDNIRAGAGGTLSLHRHWADASKVVEALDLESLRPAKDKKAEDARLVVDLFDAAGQRTTYYASRFNLCTTDNAQKHPINESFRERFRTLAR